MGAEHRCPYEAGFGTQGAEHGDCDPHLRPSALGWKSPVAFEKKAAGQQHLTGTKSVQVDNHFALQLLDPRHLGTVLARPFADITLGLAHPKAQEVHRTTQFTCNRLLRSGTQCGIPSPAAPHASGTKTNTHSRTSYTRAIHRLHARCACPKYNRGI